MPRRQPSRQPPRRASRLSSRFSRHRFHPLSPPRGFSLIELIMAVAIAAILATIAYPTYTSHVLKTRRSLAAACLQELALQLERRYIVSMSFKSPTTLPPGQCMNDLDGLYTFAFSSGEPTLTTYAIEAKPAGVQAADACGTLKLDQTGARSRDGTADVKSCWP